MTDALLAGELPFPPRPDYLRNGTTLTSWLTTTDHKRIAILFAITITIFFFMGGAAITAGPPRTVYAQRRSADLGHLQQAVLVPRHHHGVVLPGAIDPDHDGQFPAAADDRRARRRIPAAQSVQLVSDCRGGVLTVYALVAGGVDTGWTFYTPYSTMFSNSHVLAAAAGVFVVGFSSIATGVNFIATTHMLRAPGMTWFRLPLFVWAIYATSRSSWCWRRRCWRFRCCS